MENTHFTHVPQEDLLYTTGKGKYTDKRVGGVISMQEIHSAKDMKAHQLNDI